MKVYYSIIPFVYYIDVSSYLCCTAVKIKNRYVRNMANLMGFVFTHLQNLIKVSV